MSFDALPLELVASVVDFLVPGAGDEQRPQLASYGLISTTWRHAVEQRTFASLAITSLDLDSFEAFVSNSNARRRAAIRTIDFTVVLPDYSDAACACFENATDKAANNEAFSQAIARLFRGLKACEDVYKPGPIALSVLEPYSRTDLAPYSVTDPRYQGEQQRRQDTGHEYLHEHRYEHSYLRVLDVADIPCLARVSDLSVSAWEYRFYEPASIVALATKLPNLVKATWKLSDAERKYPELRTALRHDFGQMLQASHFQNLKTLDMIFHHQSPHDQCFIAADCSGSNGVSGDSLSAALRIFIQSSHLTTVKLGIHTCVDAGLFWSEQDAQRRTLWPNLQTFEVNLSLMRPDGDWYFDGDADTTESPPEDDALFSETEDEDEDEESGSNHDKKDSAFPVDGEVPDGYIARSERSATGMWPHRIFRTDPNAAFEHLLEAAARGAAHMPSLKSMLVCSDVDHRYTERPFGFEYTSPGNDSWLDQTSDDKLKARLDWSVPKDWRMGELLAGLWEAVPGKGTELVVRYRL